MGRRAAGLDNNYTFFAMLSIKSFTCSSSDQVTPFVSWSEEASEEAGYLARILGVDRADGTHK